MSLTRIVAITGCDSGLGWSIAARSAREGLITIAGMYNGIESEAAHALKKLCAHPCELDVTKPESVTRFRNYVRTVVETNPECFVNNAGIMTIGNYEWQTPTMIENTVNVNLLGAMRVVSAFLPDLRKSALYSSSTIKPRVINVASHCGLEPLPGFGPYSASKAGLLAWTRALRLEHREQGLAAVAFVPGGFVSASNLLHSQGANGASMLKHLNEEQKQFYETRIRSLNDYLKAAAQDCSYDSLQDENISEIFMNALLDENPRELYKVECWRYKLYYNLLKLPFPEATHHWLVKKFVNFPEPV